MFGHIYHDCNLFRAPEIIFPQLCYSYRQMLYEKKFIKVMNYNQLQLIFFNPKYIWYLEIVK